MEQKESFGLWLRRRRKAFDLTQAGLGQLVGCSAAAIRKFEAEERRPSAQIVNRLAEVFSIPQSEQTAFLRFARGNMRTKISESIEDVPWRAEAISPRLNLPAAPTMLIGREGEIADVCKYLTSDDIRLVTLTGPPGIGKTHLSLEIGRQLIPDYPDGVFFVPLAPLDDPTLIVIAVLRSLGYADSKDLPILDHLAISIGSKRMLILLDNCEHLIENVALLVSELLLACANLSILVTSREALRVSGEWIYSVPVLGVPEQGSVVNLKTVANYPALTLFFERASAVRSDFSLTEENIQTVASICAELDGLPLAIELIAARIRLMSPRSLLERLSGQFILSADGMRAVSARQKTIYNAINWSYNFLSAEEQTVFTTLGVFSGGFTLDAAEAMFVQVLTEKPVSDILGSLLDKSLLQRRTAPYGEPRFLMLVTIKQFALQKLSQLERETDARDRHLTYFLGFAEKGSQEMRGAHQVEWGSFLEQEHDNFRAALEWGIINQKTESVLRLLCALGWSWEVNGHYSEARCWLDRIQTLPDVNDYPLVYAELLNHIGRHSWSQGNIRDARALLEESRDISLRIGSQGEKNLAGTLNWLALVTLFGDQDCQKAKALIESGLELYQKIGDQFGVALSTFHLGIVQSHQHNLEMAVALFEQSIYQFRQFGDLFFIARVSNFLGQTYQKLDDLTRALFFYQQSLHFDTEVQFWNGIIEGWFDIGNLYLLQNDFEQASQCFEESVQASIEYSLIKFNSFYMSGLLAIKLNNYRLAYQRFSYLLNLGLMTGTKDNYGTLLLGLSVSAAGMDDPQRAARLNGAAHAIFATTRESYPEKDRQEFEMHLQKARDQLGEPIYESLQRTGESMGVERAIKYALEYGESIS